MKPTRWTRRNFSLEVKNLQAQVGGSGGKDKRRLVRCCVLCRPTTPADSSRTLRTQVSSLGLDLHDAEARFSEFYDTQLVSLLC